MNTACHFDATVRATLSVAADRLLALRKSVPRAVRQFDASPARAAYLKSP